MARNVEIKARIPDLGIMAAKVAAIATEGPIEIAQDDTFFPCAAGRLKLRQFSANSAELIFYRRADLDGPKESFYLLSPTASPDTLRESLAAAYGVVGRVHKQRTLYLVGRTRVHLDRVDGLGDFVELEVVLSDGENADDGLSEAHALMRTLGINAAQLIDVAYVDLLARRTTSMRD
jgi:predicted adenylyl cyclase CyaB